MIEAIQLKDPELINSEVVDHDKIITFKNGIIHS